jgi:hypothetical protein
MLADAMTNGVDSAALQQLLDIIFNKERQAGLSLEGTTNPKTTCGAYTSNSPPRGYTWRLWFRVVACLSFCMIGFYQPLHDSASIWIRGACQIR